tara:strand:+ start:2639 stop:2815 length:177 start_codon:yes stop_codon:yes gene_type:complete
LSGEEKFIEFSFGGFFDSLLPDDNFLLVVLFEVLAERVIKFLDIFVLFSIFNRLRKNA